MSSNAIFILDTSNGGHHKLYFNTLKENILNADFDIVYLKNSKNKVSSIISRFGYLRMLIKKSKKYQIIHQLYGDPFYILAPFFLTSRNLKHFVFTIHHLPKNKLKMYLLKMFSKRIKLILVHSEYSKNVMLENKINNVKYIDYPSFYRYDQQKNNIFYSKNKTIVTLLGGTRYDKGIDIFLKSLEYLNSATKEKMFVNIKGPEEYFKKDYITNSLDKLKVEYDLDLNYISDEDFMSNVESSDVILLPYRRIFNGNSGPMTEGVVREKCIIGPKEGNLGFLINKYNLGYTFESENPKSLAKAIETYCENGWKPSKRSKEYREKLKVDYFIKAHRELYREINRLEEPKWKPHSSQE